MSRRRPPWSALGIDPTNDERAIKRAYAGKLKAIDVEAEPAKFVALRKRYEEALWQARWIDDDGADTADDLWDEGFGNEEEDREAAADAVATQPLAGIAGDMPDDFDGLADLPPIEPLHEAANPWAAPDTDRIEMRFDRIEALLRGDEAGRDAALDRELRELWRDPLLESVDAMRDAEYRLAHLALDHGVDAQFLLRLASWHYGWAKRAQAVGTEWPIDEVGQRAAAENWIERVRKGQDNAPLMALEDLKRMPSGRWWRDYFPKRRIAEFLAILRLRFPEGEYRFDPDIVEAWDAVRNPTMPWGGLIALLPLGWGLMLLLTRRDLREGLDNPAFWAFAVAALACVAAWVWGIPRLRPKDGRRYAGPLSARQGAAFAALLILFAGAMLLPPAFPTGVALAVAAIALLPLTGAQLRAEQEREPWLVSLFEARYLLMATGLTIWFAVGRELPWGQAIVPGAIALAAAQQLRERLVASWEALPPLALMLVRGTLLCGAVILCGIAVETKDVLNHPELAVAAAALLLIVQDAAANAWRPPLTSDLYLVYILFLSALAVFPLVVTMGMVSRRLGQRLFATAVAA